MFLRPQHFQQQERNVRSLQQQYITTSHGYYWGINDFELEASLLRNGQFALSRVSATLADGAVVCSPSRDPLPSAISLDSSVRDQLVLLATPIERANGMNISASDDSVVRYKISDHDAIDTCLDTDSLETIQVARLALELKLESDNLAGYDVLPIARVISVSDEGQVELDRSFIPPVTSIKTSEPISRYIVDLHGMLKQRAEALAARIGSGQGNASSIADFLMLQMLNRYDGILNHVIHSDNWHPEALYLELVSLASEMATFSSKDKRAAKLPVYQHDDLTRVFGEVMIVLNQYMSLVLEQTAVQLPLEETNYGIRIAQIQDKGLLDRAELVLAVHASVSEDELRKRFPAQVKIGPVEHIRDLVNNQLPGIAAVGLPVAPRQIPYHAGYHYFKLDKSNNYWERLGASGGVAIHLSGKYPDLDMQFWAITS